jgi:hypothetical protein
MSDRSNTGMATLIKTRSDDGFWEVAKGIKPNQIYLVDLDTIRTEEFMNKPTRKEFSAEVIDAIQEDGEYHAFPIELLKIEITETKTP